MYHLSSVFGEDIIDHYIYGIVSDGDLMEGISTEAAELAGLWNLGKIIYFFDDNNISIDGNVTKVSITNQKNKFLSMGWDVLEIDGHQESEIIDAIKHAQNIIIHILYYISICTRKTTQNANSNSFSYLMQ